MDFETFFISSDEKIFESHRPSKITAKGRCFENERFSFQCAFLNKKKVLFPEFPRFEIVSPIKELILGRTIGEVPCSSPIRDTSDEWLIANYPCLMPDVLKDDAPLEMRYGVWQSIYLTYLGGAKPGIYPVEVIFYGDKMEELGRATYSLEIMEGELPPLLVHYSNWMHYDAIAQYFNVSMFSKRFYEIFYKYLDHAVSHGVDTLLVPCFTPALDTWVGGERLTSQLVKVRKRADGFDIDVGDAISFMKEASKRGIKRFEISHFFTQWGAEHAMKVVDINSNHIFGWETDSKDPVYLNFLKKFLSCFAPELKKAGFGPQNVFFHLSDEPNESHLERYLYLRNELKEAMGDYQTCDALSNVSFALMGAVDHPIVSLENVASFIEKGVRGFSVYYCSAEVFDHLSNRILSMSLDRTRIIGIQLYLVGAKGLLHWGYNFYNSAFSKRPIDPYLVTDADGSFPSGDSFIVYPNPKGDAYDSLRHEAMAEAFNDYRYLTLLESKIGRPEVLSLLKENGLGETLKDTPTQDGWCAAIREKIIYLVR